MSAGRVPPHDLDAEAAVLSALLLEPSTLPTVRDILTPEHFYAPANRWIYEACLGVSEEGRPIDSVTVASWLKSRERLKEIGGTAYVAKIVDAVPSLANVESYAGIVREKARVRAVISTCQRIADDGYGDTGPVDTWAGEAERDLLAALRSGERGPNTCAHIGASVRELFESISRGEPLTPTLPTGFPALDEKLDGGWRPTELVVVGARPGMGKTAWALRTALQAAAQGLEADVSPAPGVLVFSAEMARAQIALRALAAESKVPNSKLKRGQVNDDDWREMTQAAQWLTQAPIWVDDRSAPPLRYLRSRLRRVQADAARFRVNGHPTRISLVVVDYLQLMGTEEGRNREEEVGKLSRGLKALAKEENLTVVALSQLNRSVEARSDRRPILADLRDSGSIEQDANVVIFLYRDEYYNPDSKVKGLLEIHVAKQRDGSTGRLFVGFKPSLMSFEELEAVDADRAEELARSGGRSKGRGKEREGVTS